MTRHITRRSLLGRAISVLAATSLARLLPAQAEPSATSEAPPSLKRQADIDPTRVPGAPPSPYGIRSVFEDVKRIAGGPRSLTPLQDLHGIITPSSLHFERHHNGVPLIDRTRHRLLVHGLVERPMLFTIEDLKCFPAVSQVAFIECSGNSAGEWRGARGRTAQETHGLTSTSEWTGVPLVMVLKEAGVKTGATWVLAEGSDAAAMTRSLPLQAILNEALLCYAQNGEALRPEQGYPLRLLLPGWEGNACIKWLRRLKLGSEPFMTREETSHYSDLMPDGKARQFTMVMEAKSVITSPSGGQRIVPGFVEVRGLAWSGRGRITKVEVSTDGGKIWEPAVLQDPVLPRCHTRFRFPWTWRGQEAVLQARCYDDTGYRQPTRAALVAVRGANSVYHYNAIQSWKIAADGTISNVQL